MSTPDCFTVDKKPNEQFKEYLQSGHPSEEIRLITKFLINRGQDLSTLLANIITSAFAIVDGRLNPPSELDVLRMQLLFSLSSDVGALATLNDFYREAFLYLIICGGSISCRSLAIQVSKGNDAVVEALPNTKAAVIVGMLAEEIISQSKAGSNKGLETKQAIIEQWKKFTGDKTTASAFIKKLCRCYDKQGKLNYFSDVLTGEKLDDSLMATERTIRQYVNEYKKQK